MFDIIEASPERLREVDGIGPMRAAKIISAWADQKVIREIMVFLHEHGVGTARAVRIFKTYGTDAVQVMSENPYRLARDIRGIGFRTADVIAEKLGIEKTAMIRVRAGISYALTEAMGDGHCGLPVKELNALAEKLLEVDKQVDAPGLGQHVIDQFRHGRVIGHVAGQHGHAVGSFGGGATAGSEHAKARILQGFGRCMPDAGGCARHQGDARIGLVHGDHFFLCAGLRFEMSRGFVGHGLGGFGKNQERPEARLQSRGPPALRAGQLVGPAPE